jgi:manganese transport system permease protein
MGTYISYHIDSSTGGCIVVLQTLLFVLAMIFAPQHGLLVRARNSKAIGESTILLLFCHWAGAGL